MMSDLNLPIRQPYPNSFSWLSFIPNTFEEPAHINDYPMAAFPNIYPFQDKLEFYGRELDVHMLRPSKSSVDEPYFHIGYSKDDRFYVMCTVCLEPVDSRFGYENVMRVSKILFAKPYWNTGIEIAVYLYLIQRYTLIGDYFQYFGIRNMWTRLCHSYNVIVDVIDLKTEQVTKDIVLGLSQFYKVDWNYNEDQSHLRIVLKGIENKS